MDQPPTEVVEIVANIDDATGEKIGHAIDVLLADGALDAWTTPIGMKKSRPGVMVSVLCHPADRDRLSERLIELTGTFGVRYRTWDRLVLDRQHETVETEYGPIRVKVGSLRGKTVVRKPEFEDVRRAAERHRVPLARVLEAIDYT